MKEIFKFTNNKIIHELDFGDVKKHREYEIITVNDLDNLPKGYKIWNINFDVEKNGFKVYVPIVKVNGYQVNIKSKMYALDVEREEIQKKE